jgi:hypothetical protein
MYGVNAGFWGHFWEFCDHRGFSFLFLYPVFGLSFLFGVSEKFSLGRDIWPRKSEKNGMPAAKHIYTLVWVPLWSQNFQKRPLSHRMGTVHAKGGEWWPPWPHNEAHLGCVRIDASYRSPNGFFGSWKAPRWITECFSRIGQFFFDHLVFFSTASKLFRLVGTFFPENRNKLGLRRQNISTPQ